MSQSSAAAAAATAWHRFICILSPLYYQPHTRGSLFCCAVFNRLSNVYSTRDGYNTAYFRYKAYFSFE